MKTLKVAKTKPIWNETHLLLLRLRLQIPFSQLIEPTSSVEYFRLRYFRLIYFRLNQLPVWRTAELPVRKRKQLSERNKIFCLLYLPPTWINFVLYLLLLDNHQGLDFRLHFQTKCNFGHWSKMGFSFFHISNQNSEKKNWKKKSSAEPLYKTFLLENINKELLKLSCNNTF